MCHFHPVAPDFPAQAPGPHGGVFPVVLDEADVVQAGVDADRLQAAQIELLQVVGVGLQDDLILIVVLQPVGVLSIAPVSRPPRGLNIGRAPRLGAQRAQHGGRMQRTGAHLDVVRLQDHTALLAPIVMESQDQSLKGQGFLVLGHPDFAVAKKSADHRVRRLSLQAEFGGEKPPLGRG